MQIQDLRANPFALMLNPQEVVAAMERSDRLDRLQRRVCRPLDKPLIAHAPGLDDDRAIDFDAESDLGA